MRLSMSFSALSWSLCRIAPLTSSPRPCAQRVRSVCVSEVVRARDISECKQADHAE